MVYLIPWDGNLFQLTSALMMSMELVIRVQREHTDPMMSIGPVICPVQRVQREHLPGLYYYKNQHTLLITPSHLEDFSCYTTLSYLQPSDGQRTLQEGSTLQYSTIQYSTVHYSTVQYCHKSASTQELRADS